MQSAASSSLRSGKYKARQVHPLVHLSAGIRGDKPQSNVTLRIGPRLNGGTPIYVSTTTSENLDFDHPQTHIDSHISLFESEGKQVCLRYLQHLKTLCLGDEAAQAQLEEASSIVHTLNLADILSQVLDGDTNDSGTGSATEAPGSPCPLVSSSACWSIFSVGEGRGRNVVPLPATAEAKWVPGGDGSTWGGNDWRMTFPAEDYNESGLETVWEGGEGGLLQTVKHCESLGVKVQLTQPVERLWADTHERRIYLGRYGDNSGSYVSTLRPETSQDTAEGGDTEAANIQEVVDRLKRGEEITVESFSVPFTATQAGDWSKPITSKNEFVTIDIENRSLAELALIDKRFFPSSFATPSTTLTLPDARRGQWQPQSQDEPYEGKADRSLGRMVSRD